MLELYFKLKLEQGNNEKSTRFASTWCPFEH